MIAWASHSSATTTGVAVGGGLLALAIGSMFVVRMRGSGGGSGLYESLIGTGGPRRAQQGSAVGSRNLFDNPFGTSDDGSQSIALQEFKPHASL
jgi:hypothetical protein